MKFGVIEVLLVFVAGMLVVGCSANERARAFGGTSKVELANNRKLVNITWKDEGNLWILTRERRSNEPIDTYEFKENSGFGLVQGTVIIEER